MAEQMRVGDLEINQDLKFQKLLWKLERIVWCLMALFALAALAGLLGSGPLSGTSAGDRNSALWIEYNRFERYQAPAVLRIHLQPEIVREGQVSLRINRDYTANVELQRIDPEPESVTVGAESTLYVFNAAVGEKPVTIIYYLKPSTLGLLPVRVGLENGPRLEFHQFVYP